MLFLLNVKINQLTGLLLITLGGLEPYSSVNRAYSGKVNYNSNRVSNTGIFLILQHLTHDLSPVRPTLWRRHLGYLQPQTYKALCEVPPVNPPAVPH